MSPSATCSRHGRRPRSATRLRPAAALLVVALLATACTSSKSNDDEADGPAAAEQEAVANDPTLARIVVQSTDGSAFTGSRTVFALTDVDSGEVDLVSVEGTETGTRTTVPLEPGTYRIAPAGEVQVSPTASFAVRDLSTREVVVPELDEGADRSEPVATVEFGLDVERSPFDLRIDEVSATSATLIWEPLEGAAVAGYQMRLTEGTAAATGRDDGIEVALTSPTATTVVVPGLEAAREYTATLFATSAAGEELAFRSVSLTTPPADGSEPAFALAPNTIVPTDLDELAPELRDDGLVSVTLGASREQSSTTAIPGVEADQLATGCVVGTPLLVSSEVAGDDAFYGVVSSCEEQPSGWRSQQGGGQDVEKVVALLDTGVPLAQVVPYLSFRSTGFSRCVVQGGAASADSGDLCAAADADGDGMSDSTETALGLDPADPGEDWDSLVASEGRAADPGAGAAALPVSELQPPADLPSGALRVTVLWPTGDDLDLSVIDPAGAVVAGGTPSTSGGRMGRTDEGDPSCRSYITRAESAVWADAPADGTYAIQVNTFAGTPEAPRSACKASVRARLLVSVDGVVKIDSAVTVGNSCPIAIEVADGTVKDSNFLASACSYDGTRWRMVSGLADTSGDGRPGKGDTVRFFEYPKKFDGSTYAAIPMEDCVVTEFEAAFTGPPDLRVRGKTCSAYFRSEHDPRVKLHQERFGADNKKVEGGRRGPGKFDVDVWDVIRVPQSNTKDKIEEADSNQLLEQLSVRDDPFLRVDIAPVPPPSGWRSRAAGAGATDVLPRASRPAESPVVCEAEGKAQFSPQFGLDRYHDVDVTLKSYKLTWDVNAGVTAYVDPVVKASGSYQCNLDIDGVSIQLTTTPIPINLELAPTVGGGVEGSVEVTGPRLELTLGVETDGYLDASVETCSTLFFLPDVPCGLDLDSKFEADPTARFTTGAKGVTGSMKGEAKVGVGVEATIGVGTKSTFLTAKAGFAITLEPLVGTFKASAEDELAPASTTTTPKTTTTQAGTIDSVATFGNPPYNKEAVNAIWLAQAKNPAARLRPDMPFVGPTNGPSSCVVPHDIVTNLSVPGYGAVKPCFDARCLEPGPGDRLAVDRPIYTWADFDVDNFRCSRAQCLLGGLVVDTGDPAAQGAECPQGAIGTGDSSTPPAAPPGGTDAEPTGKASFCADASVGASLSVALAAEFWVLGFGDERKYPVFEEAVSYPDATFKVGKCDG